jgi:hypothetical protein
MTAPYKERFIDRVRSACSATHSRVLVSLVPLMERIPYPMQRYDDSFLPLSKAIIDATADLAAGYVFDMAAYLSIGASGAVAMERAIAYVPQPQLRILHAPFSNVHFHRIHSESAFHADAVSLHFAPDDAEWNAAPFLENPAQGVFMCTPQPEIAPFRNMCEVYPGQVGFYHGDTGFWVIEELQLFKDKMEIMYADRGDRFKDAARERASAYRDMFNRIRPVDKA